MKKFIIIAIILFTTSVFAHHEHLGKINFPTSGKPTAQPYFEKGVMFLHSFQYDEAREYFRQAERIDPTFGLAYWGEAMTFNHSIWNEQDYPAAVKTLNRYAATPKQRLAKLNNPRERGLMNAINILYGDGTKSKRDGAYEDAMRELYRQYPNDDEIASFYALSIIAASETERDFTSYMRAAGIVEDVYSHNQTHPGALHYAIHTYDDPIHAPLGLRSAREYAKAAPDASHALHMPSHIYHALGMWEEVVQSNQAAWNAGLNENKNKDPKAFTIHDLHALEWLSYAHLQLKHYATAYKLTKTMRDIAMSANTPMAKWYYAMMRGAYISETKDYSADLPSLNMEGVELSAYATDIYTNVLIASHAHDLKKMYELLERLHQATPKQFIAKTYPDFFISITCSGINTAKIIALELEALICAERHHNQSAISFLEQAAKIENDMSFGYGPPIPVVPSYELLAEKLILENKFVDAYKQYVISLKRMPNRLISFEGLKKLKVMLLTQHIALPSEVKPYYHRLMSPEFFH